MDIASKTGQAGNAARGEKMKKRLPARAVFSLCAAAGGASLRIISRTVPGFADRFSAVINPIAVGTLGRFSGIFPFSLAEILLCVLVFYVIYVLVIIPASLFRHSQEMTRTFLRHLSRLAVIASALFLIFEINEDVYFARTRFAKTYGLERDDYSDDELAAACSVLIDEINRLTPCVERDKNGIMQVSPALPDRMRSVMSRLGQTYPELAGRYPRPKPVLFSRLLSRCDITGVYSMFTIEANYNRDIPSYNLPFTMGHELAHLKGFESEKEANFIGFLAAISADDPDIRYSGAMLGWVYCGNELHRRDRARWEALHSKINEAAVLDLEDNSLYWEHYKGKAAETMHDINDAYLKAEGLQEGYASYDLVVDMIVTYLTAKR